MASSIASTGACGRDGTLAIRVSAGLRRMAMMSVNVPPILVPTSHSLFKPFISILGEPFPFLQRPKQGGSNDRSHVTAYGSGRESRAGDETNRYSPRGWVPSRH